MSNVLVPAMAKSNIIMYWVDLYDDDNLSYDELHELKQIYADAVADLENSYIC